MAASAPRRPRKAPAKKAPPKTAAEKITAFDELRAIAGDAHLGGRHTEPYVMGAEFGFDPPLEAKFPTDLEGKIALDLAYRRNDAVAILAVLLGEPGLLRAVRAFKGEADGDRLLVGLQLRLTDHFLGKGASEVGGTAASSTS